VIAIKRSSFRIELLIFLFYILRELAILMAKKRFQWLKPTNVAYPIQWGICLQKTDSGKPTS
jgi:hypothetical protein